jgi:hypothetical protein
VKKNERWRLRTDTSSVPAYTVPSTPAFRVGKKGGSCRKDNMDLA